MGTPKEKRHEVYDFVEKIIGREMEWHEKKKFRKMMMDFADGMGELRKDQLQMAELANQELKKKNRILIGKLKRIQNNAH